MENTARTYQFNFRGDTWTIEVKTPTGPCVIYDNEGDEAFTLPCGDPGEALVARIIDIRDAAYKRGTDFGEVLMLGKLRNLLGIPTVSEMNSITLRLARLEGGN